MTTSEITVSRKAVEELGLLPAAILKELTLIELTAEKDDLGWFDLPIQKIEERLYISKFLQDKALRKLMYKGFIDLRKDKNLRQIKLNDDIIAKYEIYLAKFKG